MVLKAHGSGLLELRCLWLTLALTLNIILTLNANPNPNPSPSAHNREPTCALHSIPCQNPIEERAKGDFWGGFGVEVGSHAPQPSDGTLKFKSRHSSAGSLCCFFK